MTQASDTPPREFPSQVQNIRLVVFDVEGVILPKERYLLAEMAPLPMVAQLSILFHGFLYELGIRALKPTLQHIYLHFRGMTLEEFTGTFDNIPIIPHAQKVIQVLKEQSYKIALISSGIPQPLLQRLADRLNADYAIGPALEVQEDRLTGRIIGNLIEPQGKKAALDFVLEKEGIPPVEIAVVADDRNNLAMYDPAALKIGFNPDFILATKSDYVVKGEITEILPLLAKGHQPSVNARHDDTRLREAIHMGSATIAILCHFMNLNRFFLAALILLVSIGYCLGEVARFRGRSFPPFTTLTRHAATTAERWDIATAPLYLAAGVVISLVLFPPPSGYVGIIVVALGDGVAKIVGRRWGRTTIPFNKPKKLEGSIAGVAISALAASLYASPSKALLAAIIGMTIEALPLPISDNLLIPLVASLAALLPF
ncbi:haloacid dehalogenase-like hydrolase [Candidatus Bathyarchaeota archaeon]|jgi:phosphoserine phosphatase/dolichol kinase|nr:haloacid dehalogenase-like hydrolase [Candidatus Bathyarchaeota archaeon]